MYVGGLPAHMSMCLMFEEVRGGLQILWNWSDRWLKPFMWMLGIELVPPKSNLCS